MEKLKCRFLSKVYIENRNDCWLWIGAQANGYGSFHVGENGKKNIAAHRVAYSLFVAKIPDAVQILHKCDNPLCVNPNHLFIGTQNDNVKDMFSKGRGKTPTPRIADEAMAREISSLRRLGYTYGKIGGAMGISGTTAWRVDRVVRAYSNAWK